MNIDIRVNNDFFQHPKTLRLQMELGEIAPMFLIRLWMYVSKFFPDGTIKGIEDCILEDQIGWTKNNEGKFIQTLENIGFIERIDNAIVIHDWDEHNQWASTEKNRKDLNRFNTLARYYPQVSKFLKENGINSITLEQYKAIKQSNAPLKDIARIFKIKLQKNNDDPNEQSHVRPNMQSQVQSHCESKMPQIPNTNPNSKTNTDIKNTNSSEQTSCSEQFLLQPIEKNIPDDIFIDIPLNDGTSYFVKAKNVDLWQELFPACDVKQELRSMKAWSLSNPKKRKTRKGIERHITGWLENVQNKPRPNALVAAGKNIQSPKTFLELEKEQEEKNRNALREKLKAMQEGNDDNGL